jgi:ATP adenylyltransferase
MQRPLWAPWRIEYILSEKEEGCIFCEKLAEDDDRRNLILHRGRRNFVIMNLYPYNPGHLMVAPNEHVSELEELDDEVSLEMMALTRMCVRVLKQKMAPHGFNAGINLGEIAGASIREHLHMHLVPRWQGDNNFTAVLADINVMPQALEETYDLLKAGFDEGRLE